MLPGRLHIWAPFISASLFDAQRMQTSLIPQTPALVPLSLLHLCAKYLRAQFQNKLNARSSGASAALPPQPLMLLVALASELDIIAALLVQAFFDHSQYNGAYILTC